MLRLVMIGLMLMARPLALSLLIVYNGQRILRYTSCGFDVMEEAEDSAKWTRPRLGEVKCEVCGGVKVWARHGMQQTASMGELGKSKGEVGALRGVTQ